MFLLQFLPILMAAAALMGAVSAKVWNVGSEVLVAGPVGTFDSVAVKDPSIVRYQDRWHMFYTARDRDDYTLGYISAPDLNDFTRARRHALKQLHSAKSKYAAAPQVFYFRPHQKWYLIFQTSDSNYLPVFSTTEDIRDPTSWTQAKPLVNKKDNGKWIDFWVICDDRFAYLFFTRDHKDVVVMTTKLEDFPNGFSNLRTVFSPIHEAVHVYSIRGSRPSYAMIYEQRDGERRRFGLARAGSLSGPWAVDNENFATGEGLRYTPKKPRWTDEVSHGEMLRTGWDERLQIASDRWQFLIQGMPREEHRGEYVLLPWRLGLIHSVTATRD